MGPAAVVTSTLESWISPLISFEYGAIHIRKMRRNAFQRCYRLLRQYPSFKERYTVQITGDDRPMAQ